VKPFRNVFSIVPDCHAATGHYRLLWQRHFYDGLRREVDLLVTPKNVNFEWSRTATATELPNKFRSETSEMLGKQIEAAHQAHGLDAVISYCYSRDVEIDLVKHTIQMGVPWINFFCDSTHRFSLVEALAKTTSLNWFPESAAIPKYRTLGKPLACLPYALNPDYLPQLTVRTPSYPMSFVGLPTTNRITQLGCLLLLGCPVEIRGKGWVEPETHPFANAAPLWRRFLKSVKQRGLSEKVVRRLVWPIVRRRARGPLDDSEFYDFLRCSQLVLGLNQGCDEMGRRASYLKFRDLEFPGYGCCYLSEHNEDIEKIFEIGKEILTYGNLIEAARIVRRILRNPQQIQQTGLAGRRRVLADHTWATRLEQLTEHL
jgi:hypothetical protein